MRLFTITVLSATLLLLTNGCIPYEKLVNYRKGPQDLGAVPITNAPDIRIQPDDVLSIKVFTSDPVTAAPFNIIPNEAVTNFINIQSVQLAGYLVDQEGQIDFPVLGTLKLEGMKIAEATQLIEERLLEHLKDPVVNVRLLNFRVTVSGEVVSPGSYNIVNERITVTEAITMAGDLTNYADRSNVLIVREEDGVRTFKRIDLLSTNLFQSDFFYLKQNDLIYVEPIRAKAGAIQDITNKTIPIITATATLVAVVLSISRN